MRRTTLARLLDDAPVDPALERHASTSVATQTLVQDKQDQKSPHAPNGPLLEPDQNAGQAGGDGPGTDPASPPRYLQLERKELRIRLDQADDLARLTRRLNRARGRTGERITDNTLIRVAVDLLLTRSGRLSGATELELRNSVTLKVRSMSTSPRAGWAHPRAGGEHEHADRPTLLVLASSPRWRGAHLLTCAFSVQDAR